MTRINCVDPSLLSRQHLIAEYRELPRIFKSVRSAVYRGERPDDKRNPKEYKLGTGHMRFFYPHLKYLLRRQKKIVEECIKRGYNVKYRTQYDLVDGIPGIWFKDWTPTKKAVKINIERINKRGGLRYV